MFSQFNSVRFCSLRLNVRRATHLGCDVLSIFDSARFDSASVQLSYRWLHDSPFSVHVLREANSLRWHVFKLRGQQLVSHVVGDGYGDAIIRTTSLGLADREPALTYDANHASIDEQPESTRLPSKQILVFGEIKKSGEATLIFIPEADALRLVAIHNAIQTSSTWGKFFDAIPADELDTVYERVFDDETERLPDRAEKFDSDALGVCEGDYPDWPEQKMLEWLPAHVCRQFGKMESSVLNGPYLSLDIRRTPEIIVTLAQAGFGLSWDDELVNKASGN